MDPNGASHQILDNLRHQKQITDEEYTTKRAQLLS